MIRCVRVVAFLFLLEFVAVGSAQQHAAPAPESHSASDQHSSATPPESHGEQPSGPAEQLAHASNEAAGHEEQGGHAEFKQSHSVQLLARITGLSLHAAYWVAVVFNFLIIAAVVYALTRKSLPAAFRNRTASIQQQIQEARKASEEANRRLADIESRLGRLDSESAAMRAAAEQEAAAEEERIRAQAEEDKRKIIAAAEQEIAAAAKAARRDLKAYAAELAVSIAERKLKIDPPTDEALVRTFVRQLGENDRKERG